MGGFVPYWREVYEMYQHKGVNILTDSGRSREYFATRKDCINRSCFAGTFHTFSVFFMMRYGHLAEEGTSTVYIGCARKPDPTWSLGLKGCAAREDGLSETIKKVTGTRLKIPTLPKTSPMAAVHPCRKNSIQTSHCTPDEDLAV